jgi:hypothetical protein
MKNYATKEKGLPIKYGMLQIDKRMGSFRYYTATRIFKGSYRMSWPATNL